MKGVGDHENEALSVLIVLSLLFSRQQILNTMMMYLLKLKMRNLMEKTLLKMIQKRIATLPLQKRNQKLQLGKNLYD